MPNRQKYIPFLLLSACLAVAPAYAAETPVESCQKCLVEATKLINDGDLVRAADLMQQSSAQCVNNAQFQTLLSTVLLRTSKVESAEKAAIKAIEIAPNNVAAHFQYALALKGLGKKTEAIIEFDKVVELDPSNWESWASLADLYKELHQDDKAKQCEYKAATLSAPTISARNSLCKNLIQQGNLLKAEEEFIKSLNAYQQNPVVLQQLAKQALAFNFWNAAITASNSVLEKFPDSQEALTTKATGQYFLHKYADCQNTLTAIAKVSPDSSDAKVLSALCLIDLGEITQAAEILEAAKAPKENLPLSYLAVAKWHQARGDLKAAEIYYGAIADEMLLPEAQIALSRLYAKEGRIDEAIEKATFNATSQMSSSRMLAARAEAICQGSNSLDMARVLAAKALSISPDEPSALLAVSKIELQAGNKQEAQNIANKVIEKIPGEAEAYLVLAKLELSQSNTKEAEKQLDKVLSLANDDPDASFLLGKIYLQDGNTKKALDSLKAALAGRQDSAEICYVLAKALEQEGDQKASLKYYKQSLSLGLVGTENAEASQAVKRLSGKSQE